MANTSDEPAERLIAEPVSRDGPMVALVFSGGLGLASYHAGVFHAFTEAARPLHWVAGSSSGSVTAALIAGNAPAARRSSLQAFWNMPAHPRSEHHPWRHFQGWVNAASTHLIGTAGFFHPRVP